MALPWQPQDNAISAARTEAGVQQKVRDILANEYNILSGDSVASLTTRMKTAESNITTNTNNIATNTTNIATNTSNISNHETRITALEGAGSATILGSTRTSDISRSATSFVTTGLSVSIPSAGTYYVSFFAVAVSSGTIWGPDFTLNYSGTSSKSYLMWDSANTATSQKTGWSSTAGTIDFSGGGASTTDSPFFGKGILKCSTTGTLALHFASQNVAETITLRSGASFMAIKIA